MRLEGTFVTRKYASPDDAEPCEIAVAHNNYAADGIAYLWAVLLGQRSGRMDEALISVGNGVQPNAFSDTRLRGGLTATAPLDDGFPQVEGWIKVDDEPRYRVVFHATFGPQDANFDWRERGVQTPDGILIDRSVSDQGSKVVGAVWTAEVMLDMVL